MPSTDTPKWPFRPRSLVDRMAYATAFAAGGVAIVASVLSLAVADRLVREAEDRRLRATAIQVLHELPDPTQVADDALKHAVDEEAAELLPSSIGVSVRRGRDRVGGDAEWPAIEAGECRSLERPKDRSGAMLRACAVEERGLVVVAGTARASYGVGTVLLASLVSAVFAAAMAAFLGRRLARWALEPLTRLASSLDAVAAEDPKRTTIAGDDTCVEVATLRKALTALVARLGDALDAARSFSAEAAHELKTPLTTIRAELELLQEEPLGEAERVAVEKLCVRTRALARLVDRLLSLATVTDGSRLAEEAVALEDVATRVVAGLEESQRARITTKVSAAGMVRGDEELLVSLLENAVENALKFSTGNVEIFVTEDSSLGDVLVDVQDHGEGLPKALRERVFEPFFRSPEARGANTQGHGIGLALVSRIAASHGGRVGFEDPADGSGACLRLRLPMWKERA